MKKKLMALFVVVALLFSIAGTTYALTPLAEPGPNKDVGWTDGFLQIAIAEEWMPGDYKASTIMTCADFSVFLWRAIGRPPIQADELPFDNVPKDSKYYLPLLSLVGLGVFDGMPKDAFEAFGLMSRETALFMITRAFALEAESDCSYFEDFDELPDWAKDATYSPFLCEIVMMMNQESGIEEWRKLYPQITITAGEAAFLVIMTIESTDGRNDDSDGKVSFGDIWNQYAYEKNADLDGPITRGEFAYMLWSFFYAAPEGNQAPFADIAEDAYYYNAVADLYADKVVSGYSANTFGPNDILTREMAITMIVRSISIENDEAYRDYYLDYEEISDWAKPYYLNGFAIEFSTFLNTYRDSSPRVKDANSREKMTRIEAAALLWGMGNMLESGFAAHAKPAA